MADFEFNNVLTPQSLLSIDQTGSCAIEASNDEGYFYYLVISTCLGETTIAECGPIVPDLEEIPSGFVTRLSRMDYDMKKINNIIVKWLNDKKAITEATCIEKEEALNQFRDLGKYLLREGK